MKVNQILEAKYASRSKEGWLWAVEQDIKTTLKNGYDRDTTLEYLDWVKDYKDTLDHLYKAIQQDAIHHREYNMAPNKTPVQVISSWYGKFDYSVLPIYRELRKKLPFDELDYATRIILDVVVDEIRNGEI